MDPNYNVQDGAKTYTSQWLAPPNSKSSHCGSSRHVGIFLAGSATFQITIAFFDKSIFCSNLFVLDKLSKLLGSR
jgi:hypothetical protein